MTDVTISALPVAASIADSDLVVVVEIGTPNVTKRATAAQMRAPSLPLTGGTVTGALTVNAALTVNSTGKFTDTLTLNASGGWSSSNAGKQLLVTTPSGVSNPAIGITDANGANLFGIYNKTGTLKIASMPAYTDGVTAPTDVVQVTATGVTLNKGLAVTGNSKITGTLETTSTLTVDGGALIVSSGGLIVSANGAAITGNTKITGTLETTSTLTVDAGGVVVTGNSTITGTLGGLTGLTVASGGANITGNSNITGTLGSLTGLTVASGGANITGNSTITGTLGGLTGLTVASGGANITGATAVTGTLSATTSIAVQNGVNGMVTNNAGNMTLSFKGAAGSYLTFYNDVTKVGDITGDGGVGVLYNTVSDQRLKIDLGRIEEGGNIIDGLMPRWFKWKSDPNEQTMAGFFAQEMHRMIPSAVSVGRGEPGDAEFTPWRLDATRALPFIVAELQALRRRVAQLESALA